MTLPLHDPDDAALARTLGQAGLIPFVMLAALLWLVDVALQPWVAIAMTGYAALIISFLGGIHWGLGWLGGRHERGLPHARTTSATTSSGASCHRYWPGRAC